MEFNSEYGKYYLNDEFYPIHVRSQRPMHRRVWLIETNKIRRDLGLKPLTQVPKGFQIHHKNGCRTDFEYNNFLVDISRYEKSDAYDDVVGTRMCRHVACRGTAAGH